MTTLFLKLLEMSITGSVVIMITILAGILLRKRSKRYIMILWLAVAVRLLLPVSIESSISVFNLLPFRVESVVDLVNGSEEISAMPAEVDIPVSDNSPIQAEGYGTKAGTASHKMTDPIVVASVIWIVGMAGISVYFVLRYIMLKLRLKGALKAEKDIFLSEKVSSPFVLGLIKPKIYLPEVIDNTQRECVLMHERTHIRRGDHIRKTVAVIILTIHWFNPLVWLAYFLFEQDLEMSCDEAAIKGLDPYRKEEYALSLVTLARKSNNRNYLVTLLGFSNPSLGKITIKSRVKNLIDHKAETMRTTMTITIALLLVAASCGFNAKAAVSDLNIALSAKYWEAGDDLYQRYKPELKDSGVELKGLYCRGSDKSDIQQMVFIETLAKDKIIAHAEPSVDDCFKYYTNSVLSLEYNYTIARSEVNIGGQDYSNFELTCNGCGGICNVYIGKTDGDYVNIIYVEESSDGSYVDRDALFIN
ncbi:MAG: hypothetical protein J6U23_07075 [Clostridiales bacterium]|nr:hypothetical protein [Clostridiales bacterium]